MNDTMDNKTEDGFDDLLEDLTEPEHSSQLTLIYKPTIMAPVKEYEYAGVELFPSVFKEIMLKMYLDKQFTRLDAIKEVTNYHMSHGGM